MDIQRIWAVPVAVMAMMASPAFPVANTATAANVQNDTYFYYNVCNRTPVDLRVTATWPETYIFAADSRRNRLRSTSWVTVTPGRCHRGQFWNPNSQFYYVHIHPVDTRIPVFFDPEYEGPTNGWPKRGSWCVSDESSKTWPEYYAKGEVFSPNVKCPAGTYRIRGFRAPFTKKKGFQIIPTEYTFSVK